MADSDAFRPRAATKPNLFREFNGELMIHVNSAVFDTTPQNIEDACAFAWTQFLRYQPSRESQLAWLAVSRRSTRGVADRASEGLDQR